MNPGAANIKKYLYRHLVVFLVVALFVLGSSSGTLLYKYLTERSFLILANNLVANKTKEITGLKSRDEYKINQNLQGEVKNIHDTYSKASSTYERLADLKVTQKDTGNLDKLYAQALNYLSDKNYASASATLADLNSQIDAQEQKAAPSAQLTQIATGTTQSNTPPGSGYSRQTVHTNSGDFTLDIIAADLNSTRVIVDSASSSDCSNNCPVMPLADYANRNGAFAAVNGPFFCPPEYPSCAGKTNSFDTLLMNKNKTYFNSSNNVYSTVPAVIFSGNSGRFVTQSLEWGRDTNVDSVIANYPLLVLGGNIMFTENPNEPKFGARGTRCFIGITGSTVYIGTIYSATMGEAAQVVKALGINSALNLDEGGSTALWYQGRYLAGPGRNLPFGVLLVHK